MNPVGIIS